MINHLRESPGRLPELFHHRWAVPALAALVDLNGGAKFVTLQRRLDVGRDSLVRTLEALTRLALVRRNPGYGHPMRPEYLLTDRGRQIGPVCRELAGRLDRLGIADVALNKWSLPVVQAIARAGGRFNQLLETLKEITPRALTRALRDLEEAGLATRYLVDDHPPRSEYALTRRGLALVPLIARLA